MIALPLAEVPDKSLEVKVGDSDLSLDDLPRSVSVADFWEAYSTGDYSTSEAKHDRNLFRLPPDCPRIFSFGTLQFSEFA